MKHTPTAEEKRAILDAVFTPLHGSPDAEVEKRGGALGDELRQWLDSQHINGDNIGTIRRQCFMPWDSAWNALVRDETAAREK